MKLVLAILITFFINGCSHVTPKCTSVMKNCVLLGPNLWECEDVAMSAYERTVSNRTCE